MIESLEPRRLMSATVVDGVLKVVGTEAADRISFENGQGTVTVHLNGEAQTFPTADLRRVEVRALGGDDDVALGRKLALPATVFGGDGDDRIGGSRLSDVLLGEAGDDTIDGRFGDDYVDGGDGGDRLYAYYGTNTIRGGAGTDHSLGDGLLLGDAVENRRLVALRDAIVTRSDKYDVDGLGYSGTRLFREDGRLILEYTGQTGSGANRVSFSDAATPIDGTTEVGVTIGFPTGGVTADVQTYTHRWDVTDGERRGLSILFTSNRLDAEDGDRILSSTTNRYALILTPDQINGVFAG